MNKKIISLFLSLVLTLSVSLEAMAATNLITINTKGKLKDLTNDKKTSIIDVLDLGIMQGDEYGNFNPDNYLTKAEATAIVTRMKGLKTSSFYTDQKFKDVPPSHWSFYEVGLAVDNGLIQGDGVGYFNPDKTLNGLELITMCLRVMGVGEMLDQTNNWPQAHMMFVNNNRLISNYNKSVYDPITRLDAARIVSQFLSCDVYVKNPRTGVPEVTSDTVSSKYLGIKTYKDVIITQIDESANEISGLYQDEYGQYTQELESLYLSNAYDIDDYEIGMVVNISVTISDSIMKIDVVDGASTRVVFYDSVTDYNASGDFIKVKVDGRITKYLFSENLLMVDYNGTVKTGTENKMSSAKRLLEKAITYSSSSDDDDDDDDDNPEYDEVSGRIIVDEANKIISISVWKFDHILYVKSVSGSSINANTSSNHSSNVRTTKLSLGSKDYDIKDYNGRSLTLDDIDKDDALLISGTDPIVILRLDDAVFGKVSYSTGNSDDYELDEQFITVDEEDYYLNPKFCKTVPSKSTSTNRTIYLDQNGKIVGWK